MKKVITQITTADTKKTYEFTGKKNGEAPQLWFLEIRGHAVEPSDGSHTNSKYAASCDVHHIGDLYVERQTLVNAGALPKSYNDQPATKEETVEELFLRLLEKVGFHLTE